jgi:hypothetical protein
MKMNEALEQLKSMRDLLDELLSLGNVDYKYAKRYENEWLEKAPGLLAEKVDEVRSLIEYHMEQVTVEGQLALNAELEKAVEMKVSA